MDAKAKSNLLVLLSTTHSFAYQGNLASRQPRSVVPLTDLHSSVPGLVV